MHYYTNPDKRKERAIHARVYDRAQYRANRKASN